MSDVLRIGTRTYHRPYGGTFEVHIDDLGDFTSKGMPCGSTVEVAGLPGTRETFSLNVSVTHQTGECESSTFINFFVTFYEAADPRDPLPLARCDRKVKHIERHFRELVETGILDSTPVPQRHWLSEGWYFIMLYGLKKPVSISDKLRELIEPAVTNYTQMLAAPLTVAFICHASEDRAFVERLVTEFDRHAIETWLDRREIKVGESIVQRIQTGLTQATHLVVVLSKKSIAKPWVTRELSSALLQQLKDNSITILPLLMETCEVPLLLRDIKYADCSSDFSRGITELLRAIGQHSVV